MPPRPLGQIMWFYRQLEPILRGVLAGEIVLPTSLGEAREIRPYNRGTRLDRQSVRSLVVGQLATSQFMSMDSMEGSYSHRRGCTDCAKAICTVGQ